MDCKTVFLGHEMPLTDKSLNSPWKSYKTAIDSIIALYSSNNVQVYSFVAYFCGDFLPSGISLQFLTKHFLGRV